jgi:hypothetical protein
MRGLWFEASLIRKASETLSQKTLVWWHLSAIPATQEVEVRQAKSGKDWDS